MRSTVPEPPEYHLTFWRRLGNAAMRLALQLDIAPRRYALLTVRGRKSGRAYSTPVIVLQQHGERFLVAPYGERTWVRNARAAGEVTLSRGGRAETLRIEELGAEEAAPLLKRYVAETPITRPFFAVAPDAPVEAFVAEAARHPVFRLRA
jgi:deazaflavin-dependent oxidoreductase (nitroreductase family)